MALREIKYVPGTQPITRFIDDFPVVLTQTPETLPLEN